MTPLELLRDRRRGAGSNGQLSRFSRIDRSTVQVEPVLLPTVIACEGSEKSAIRSHEPPDLDTAAAWLDRLEDMGFTVRVVDETLRVGPIGKMTGEIQRIIRRHRELMVALVATAEPVPSFAIDTLPRGDEDLAAFVEAEALFDPGRVSEARTLGLELRRLGPEAIAAFRWFARHPAPGNARLTFAKRTRGLRGPRSRPLNQPEDPELAGHNR